MEVAIAVLHVLRFSQENPGFVAVAVLFVMIAFRQEIGDWIGRRFFGNRRRPY
jgi:hypothetical protein